MRKSSVLLGVLPLASWIGCSGSPIESAEYGAEGAASGTVSSSNPTSIKNINDGLCLTVGGGSLLSGAPVQQTSCNGQPNQQFILSQKANGYYNIRAQNSSNCVRPQGGGTSNGTPLDMEACNATYTSEEYTLQASTTGAYALVNHKSGRCVDVPWSQSTVGLQLQIYDCNGTSAQSFATAVAIVAPTPTSPPPTGTPPTPVGGLACIASAVNGQMAPFGLSQVDFMGTPAPTKQLLSGNPTLAPYSAAAINYYYGGWNGSLLDIRGYGQNDAATHDYGNPFYFATASDPLVQIHCTASWGCSTAPYTMEGAMIHIPAKARATGGSDHHLTVIQPDGMEYDFWLFPVLPGGADIVDGQTINVASGGVSNMLSGTGFLPQGGATAGGNAQLASAILDSEIFSGSLSNPNVNLTASINHALATGFVCGGTFWGGSAPSYPSHRSGADSKCGDGKGMPEGSRLWLDLTDAQVDALNIDPIARPVLKALHHYGAFIIDTGGCSSYPCPTGQGSGIRFNGPGQTAQYYSYGNSDPTYSYGRNHGWTHAGSTGGSIDRYLYSAPSGIVDWASHIHVLDPCVTTQTCAGVLPPGSAPQP
ncbi:MAG: hypothetical protein NVS3B20_00270 [Polyangiales bacterium]